MLGPLFLTVVGVGSLLLGAAIVALLVRIVFGVRSGVLLLVGYIGSLAGILVLTLTPTEGDKNIRLVPFSSAVHALTGNFHKVVFVEALANLLLFVPYGASLRLRGHSLSATAIRAASLSLAIELLQLVIPGRTTATEDWVLNVAGGCVGYIMVNWWLERAAAEAPGQPHEA
jgi:glycopeptide antibiotics resistance protein